MTKKTPKPRAADIWPFLSKFLRGDIAEHRVLLTEPQAEPIKASLLAEIRCAGPRGIMPKSLARHAFDWDDEVRDAHGGLVRPGAYDVEAATAAFMLAFHRAAGATLRMLASVAGPRGGWFRNARNLKYTLLSEEVWNAIAAKEAEWAREDKARDAAEKWLGTFVTEVDSANYVEGRARIVRADIDETISEDPYTFTYQLLVTDLTRAQVEAIAMIVKGGA